MEDGMNPGLFGGNEVDLLSQIVREAYSDTLATETWTRVLDMVDGLVAYDAGGAIFANVQTGRLENVITSKVDAELLRSYREHSNAIDVLANIAVARKLTIWQPSDVIGKHEWEASELYITLGKAYGHKDLALAQASRLGPRQAGTSLL